MEDKPTSFPTWGYKADGSERLFDLKEGESLPDGWSDRQELWNHPNSRHLHSAPAHPGPPPPPAAEQPHEPNKRGPGRPRSPEHSGL
jgi:hypothetical protein